MILIWTKKGWFSEELSFGFGIVEGDSLKSVESLQEIDENIPIHYPIRFAFRYMYSSKFVEINPQTATMLKIKYTNYPPKFPVLRTKFVQFCFIPIHEY